MEKTTEEIASQLAEMKSGDSLSALGLSANQLHELGKAYLELLQKYKDLEDDYNFRVTC